MLRRVVQSSEARLSGTATSAVATISNSSSGCALATSSSSSSTPARLVTALRHQTASFAPFATTRMQTSKPVKVVRSPSANAPRLEGFITAWHFVERTGEIEVKREGGAGSEGESPVEIYKIKNAQSFETIMPTSHRQSLVGTKVRFVPASEPCSEEPSGIERSALGIEMLDLDEMAARRRGEAPGSNTSSLLSPNELARRLSAGGVDRHDEPSQNKPTWGLTDLRAETLFAPGGFLSQGSGPSYAGPRVASSGALSRLEQREVGDGMTLEGNLVRVEAPAGFFLDGEIVAWSGITRTGLIRVPDQREDDGRDVQYAVSNVDAFNSAMPSSVPLRGARVRFRPVHMHAVANTDEVVATSGKCKLRLGKVVLSIAERIDIVQLPAAREKQLEEQKLNIAAEAESIAAGETTGERKSRVAAAAREKKARQLFKEWREDEREEFENATGDEDGKSSSKQAATPVPAISPPQFGVVTRWSGGQGIIESGTGKTFRIDSAKEFSTYFDVSSVSVRGAVVEFVVHRERPRYAADIKVLSDMSAARDSGSIAESSNVDSVKKQAGGGNGSAVPLSSLPFDLSIDITSIRGGEQEPRGGEGEGTATATEAQPERKSWKQKKADEEAQSVDFSKLPARHGVLVTYSPAEFQGVVKDEQTGERFLLRDTRHDVQHFGRIKSKLARGCKLEFRAVGSSGRLATFASLTMLANGETPATVDQEELDASEGLVGAGGEGGADGGGDGRRQDEAVAGPMSMSYWVARFEKVGCNMQEFKSFQQQAFVPGEAPTDQEGKKMEVEDFRKNDPWFNDPEKNRKIPGTNARFSDLMQLNQTGLIEISNDMRDPQTLKKKMTDLEEKVPLEYREQGMKKAKEFGPRYFKSIKDAQKRGDSAANFNFSG